jgi:hypothetical protein
MIELVSGMLGPQFRDEYNFTYPLRCLRVPLGVRVSQVEYHRSREGIERCKPWYWWQLKSVIYHHSDRVPARATSNGVQPQFKKSVTRNLLPIFQNSCITQQLLTSLNMCLYVWEYMCWFNTELNRDRTSYIFFWLLNNAVSVVDKIINEYGATGAVRVGRWNQSKKVKLSRNRPWRPMWLWDVEAPTFARQLAHRWRWGCQPRAPAALYPPGIFLVLISVRG